MPGPNSKEPANASGSALLSPTSASAPALSPSWRPPKSPLAPHRLAKLANALGVSTPVPAGPPASLTRSYSESSNANSTYNTNSSQANSNLNSNSNSNSNYLDYPRRSPTPSSASASTSLNFSSYPPPPSTSKFLLHVIPPLHLPHDSDSTDDTQLPPPNAPGYHTHFRRGTLVPVHSTLQAQLGAIAREYALPSSTGLILYLVSSTSNPQSPSPSPASSSPASYDIGDEPGPRLSEDIWKHLWVRVVRAEQRDEGLLLPSRSPTPQTPHTPRSPLMLRLAPAARSTPFLTQEQTTHLRPFGEGVPPAALPPSAHQSTQPQPQPTTTAPSTPTSTSDHQSQSTTKSAPPSVLSQSEPGTPDTSVEDSGIPLHLRSGANLHSHSHSASMNVSMGTNFLDLPGLNSPSLIPILAKVEFDIDRRRAGWYEPWVRSRRVNHAKRTEGRKGSRSRQRGRTEEDEEGGDGGGKGEGKEVEEKEEKKKEAPIELLMGKKRREDPFGLRAQAEAEAEAAAKAAEAEAQAQAEAEMEAQAAIDAEMERERELEVERQEAEAREVALAQAQALEQEREENEEHVEEEENEEEEQQGAYARLSESPEEINSNSDSDSDVDEFNEEATARVSATLILGSQDKNLSKDLDQEPGQDRDRDHDQDPLTDVFGSDGDTWAEIRASNGAPQYSNNPNVVNLALTAAELSALPDETLDDFSVRDEEDETKSTKEEDEVFEMLEMMGRPELAVTIPSPEKPTSPTASALNIKRSSSPSVSRRIPPPLVLKPKDKSTVTAAGPGTDGVLVTALNGAQEGSGGDTPRLAYLGSGSGSEHSVSPARSPLEASQSDKKGTIDGNEGGMEKEDERVDEDDYEEFMTRVRSPAESDKRGGAVFDDLDLGLDPSEDFDDNDPNDRRRSQYLMSAQLDEIEKTMASLSPRFMTMNLEEEQNMSFNSATLSPSTPANLTLSPGQRSFDFLPPSSPTRLPQHPDPPEHDESMANQSWPAVPFSSIKDREPTPDANAPPSPPRLAVNGVSTSAPKSYLPTSRTNDTGPTESERRKKELEDEEALYLPPKPIGMRDRTPSPSGSPIIPLSPDPFGRHPSTPEPPTFQVSGAQWDSMAVGIGGAGSGAAMTIDQIAPPVPRQGRGRSNTTSRFSTDSVKAEADAAAATAAATAAKSSNRATLMSVKTIKKLWRKSNKSSTPSVEQVPAVPPTPTSMTMGGTPTTSGRSSPAVPQRPERPSQDQLYLPDMPDVPLPAGLARLSQSSNNSQQQQMPPRPASQNQMYAGRRSLEGGAPQSIGNGNGLIPPSPHLPPQEPGRASLDHQNVNMGRLSPQLMPPHSQSQPRPSLDQMAPGTGSRMSLEQLGRRPSQEHQHQPQQQQQFMPPPPPLRQSTDQFAPPPPLQQFVHPQQQQQQQQQQYPPPQQQQFQQLNIPSYPGRNPNAGPIITPYMQAARAASNLDRLHFDQESPYPTHRSAPVRQSPRPPSPTALPAIPEGGDNNPAVARKSILRWKSAASTSSSSSSQSNPSSEHQTRTSLDRSSTNGSFQSQSQSQGSGGGGRRPSLTVNSYASTARTSVTSPELPPSPQIPSHFVKQTGGGGGLDHRTSSQRSRLTTSSTDSSYSPPQRQISLGARSISPQRSMASSRDSGGSRPSFDASQFEFVSPPKGATLSYPFNTLDQ